TNRSDTAERSSASRQPRRVQKPAHCCANSRQDWSSLKKSGKPPSRRSKPAKARARPSASASAFATTITIEGSFGSHALEALQLELRRLADSCGLKLETIEVETHDV